MSYDSLFTNLTFYSYDWGTDDEEEDEDDEEEEEQKSDCYDSQDDEFVPRLCGRYVYILLLPNQPIVGSMLLKSIVLLLCTMGRV